MAEDSVKSLMNSRVISVLPDTSIKAAIDILLGNNFNGLPVTDKNGTIIGILTKYDIIVNRASINDETKVQDLMNTEPLVLYENMTVDDAIRAFSEHHKVDPIPVIDSEKKVVGVISRFDMVRMFREYGVAFNAKDDKPAVSKGKSPAPVFLIVVLIIAGLLAGVYYFRYFGGFF